ncbi:MAG: c-type cytochrome [Proteobacteria bacterium]|nr:c-type cytochrome [Pseudomonadota bacterium]
MKLLRWLGKIAVGVAVLAALGLGFVYWRSNQLLAQRIQVDEPALTISTDPATIARGEHLAVTRGCTDCHGSDFGGKVLVESLPVGRITGPNLTRGMGGIGDPDPILLERAIRHGIGADGHLLIYMPATDYAGLSDADTGDLMAYIASRAAVDRVMAPPLAGPLIRVLFLLGKAPLAYGLHIDPHAAHIASIDAEPTIAYGRYLAQGCTGCHRLDFSGGHVPGTPPSFADAANITSDPVRGIGRWSKADFYNAIRHGKKPDGKDVAEFMPWRALGTMSDTELDALWAYLRTVPAVGKD